MGFAPGDRVRIVAEHFDHEYEIGQVITLGNTTYDDDDGPNWLGEERSAGLRWYVYESEIEALEETAARGPLAVLADEVAEINEANGWATPRAFGDDIALLHSEVSEAYEDYRNGRLPGTRFLSAVEGKVELIEEELPAGQDKTEWLEFAARHPESFKPEGIPSELADILIRVLDTARRYDIDLDDVVREKLAFNRTRGHRHGGKVV